MLDDRRKQYLEAMGIQAFVRRGVSQDTADSPEVPEPSDEGSGTDSVSVPAVNSDWEALKSQVATCTACALHESRTQTVFGVGNPNADLLVIGEAPGADEDRQGEPFVGRAGQLLTAMLKAIGLRREDVYIANILKCRPPGNRNPSPSEVTSCLSFLERQVAFIQPRLILSVGAVSAHNLLGTEEAVGRLRGRVHEYGEGAVPLVVTYHPAYLLRQPAAKAKAWQDLQKVMRILNS